ncbi:MAG: VOC family protein [Paracoccaceae bacterium]|nr:VOC family protein [Paracoccaceae bacterium]
MQFDHMAVSGNTLAEASDHIEQALGVALQDGGQHALFGTYNRLLGLADGLYLEAIACDPSAPDPGRARWFDLDRFSGNPRLTNWICRCDDIGQTLKALPKGLGHPVDLTRGVLRWRMAVPDDGILPNNGSFPALIQWQTSRHPARMLPSSGCRLRQLTIAHPEASGLQAQLGIFSDTRVVFETAPKPGFSAVFDTPHGPRILE